ncbi:tyrosine-type recombinase/integrase [Shewanella sp. 10N.286.45.A1]|uniref:tyrosine-type recombinase/integrase n=1 Tax=Shewanella sp. 10N.286.45.A1 TaxID=3229694 RepID=UPI00354FDF76
MLYNLIIETLLPCIKRLFKEPDTQVSDEFLTNFKLHGLSKMAGETKAEKNRAKLNDWFNKEINYIEINISTIANLNIRLYRNSFATKNNELEIHQVSAVVFYCRARSPHLKHSRQKKICDLSAGKKLVSTVESYLAATATQKETYQNGHNIHTRKSMPTLGEYLPEYESLIYLRNPKKTKSKINLIEHHFPNLLSTPINEISKSHLLKWLRSHTIKLTSQQINSGISPFDLKESTLKGAMSTLRAAIRAASEDPRHPFVFDQELVSNTLKLQVNNIEDKYYQDDELAEIYTELATRDKEKLKGKITSSAYADYFTPLSLLCFYTGLRPSYALKIKKSDINFSQMTLKISGTEGKIKKDYYITINIEIEKVLKEWLKHSCHKKMATPWLFPSPTKKGAHISSYKKAQATFKARLSFKHFDFRIIRHTFATIFTRQTNDIFQTQKAMMHGDIISTMRYAHHIMSRFNKELSDFGANMASRFMPN